MKKLLFTLAFAFVLFSCSKETTQENESKENAQNNENVLEAKNTANAVSENSSVETTANAVSDEKNTTTETPSGGNSPQMTFTETTHDFGNIKQGDKVAHTFVFRNTGKAPVIIKRAQGSCGCTVPNYPKEPIAPGEEGKIHVEFNSAGKSGKQNKTVTLTTNMTPAEKILTITANVATGDNKGAPYK